MPKHGKRYREADSLIEKDRDYEPSEAIALAKESASAKFDETVELHIRTGADPRHADQMVRGVVLLPHGVGKPVRVAAPVGFSDPLWLPPLGEAHRTNGGRVGAVR